MRTWEVEDSLRRFFDEKVALPEKHSDRVFVHWNGEAFKDNQLAWIMPRFQSMDRSSGPRDGDVEVYTMTFTVVVKKQKGGGQFGLLSMLVDAVRLVIDQALKSNEPRAVAPGARGAAKLFDREKRAFAVMDFGPAAESRSYGQSISVSGVTLREVDLAVLTVNAQLSPLFPRVIATT